MSLHGVHKAITNHDNHGHLPFMSCMYNFLPILLVLVGAIRLVVFSGVVGDKGGADKDVVGDRAGTEGRFRGGRIGPWLFNEMPPFS